MLQLYSNCRFVSMVFVSWEVCFYVLYSVSSDLFVLFCKDWVFVVEIHSTT